MKRVLVVSDSHKYTYMLTDVLFQIGAEINAVIHLGDGNTDLDAYADIYPDVAMFSVRGNCDFESARCDTDEVFELFGRRLFVTHGHNYYVKSGIDRLAKTAENVCAQIVMFGHTHEPLLEVINGIMVMNPGSVSLPKDFGPSYGILVFEDDKLTASVVEVKDGRPNVLLSENLEF